MAEAGRDGSVEGQVSRRMGRFGRPSRDGRDRTEMLDDFVNAALAPRTVAAVLTGIAAAATS